MLKASPMAKDRACRACHGRGKTAPGWIERDDSGLPARLCFGRMRDCEACEGSGRVATKPRPIKVTQAPDTGQMAFELTRPDSGAVT